MGKKKKGLAIPFVYLIGMVLACVGYFLPLYVSNTKVLGKLDGLSTWGVLTNKDSKALTIVLCVSVLILIAAGIVFCFLKIKGVSGIARLIAAAGGLVCFISLFVSKVVANTPKSDFGKKIAKNVAKGVQKAFHIVPHVGFYLVIIGFIVAIVGWVLCRED